MSEAERNKKRNESLWASDILKKMKDKELRRKMMTELQEQLADIVIMALPNLW